MSEHLTEPRADLEQRFLIMGNILLKARGRIIQCGLYAFEKCPACAAAATSIPLPVTVIAASHEPREDLESAVEQINDRLETIALTPDNGCPTRAFVYGLLTNATERLRDDA